MKVCVTACFEFFKYYFSKITAGYLCLLNVHSISNNICVYVGYGVDSI